MKHSNCVLGGFDGVPGYRMTEVFMVSSFSKGSLDEKWVGWECCVNAGTRRRVCHWLPLVAARLVSSELASCIENYSVWYFFSFTEVGDQFFGGLVFFFLSQNYILCYSFCLLNDSLNVLSQPCCISTSLSNSFFYPLRFGRMFHYTEKKDLQKSGGLILCGGIKTIYLNIQFVHYIF